MSNQLSQDELSDWERGYTDGALESWERPDDEPARYAYTPPDARPTCLGKRPTACPLARSFCAWRTRCQHQHDLARLGRANLEA